MGYLVFVDATHIPVALLIIIITHHHHRRRCCRLFHRLSVSVWENEMILWCFIHNGQWSGRVNRSNLMCHPRRTPCNVTMSIIKVSKWCWPSDGPTKQRKYAYISITENWFKALCRFVIVLAWLLPSPLPLRLLPIITFLLIFLLSS